MIINLSSAPNLPQKSFKAYVRLLIQITAAAGISMVVLIFLFLYALAPQLADRPDFSKLAQYDYAHRGLHNQQQGIPENSLTSFRLAAESGYGVELDLQLTRDNQVVVFHDKSLNRLFGIDMEVKDITFDDLRQYRLPGTLEAIPTLYEALEVIDGHVPIIVELKEFSPAQQICPLVQDILKDYQGLYCVQSFSSLTVKWYHDNEPDVIRGQLMHNLEKDGRYTLFQALVRQNLCTNFMTRPNFAAYEQDSRKCPAMWLAKNVFNMPEISWTIRDPDTYNALKEENCIIIFEDFIP